MHNTYYKKKLPILKRSFKLFYFQLLGLTGSNFSFYMKKSAFVIRSFYSSEFLTKNYSFILKLFLIFTATYFFNDYFYCLYYISSAIRQKGESQSGCYRKTKHAKYSEKQIFLTP